MPGEGERIKKLYGFIGGTILSYAFAYVATLFGGEIMSQFIVGIIGLAIGGYYGVKYAREKYG